MISKAFIERENLPNEMQAYISANNLNRTRTDYVIMDTLEFEEFTKLSLTDLYHITLGTYQMKQTLSYITHHLADKGLYTFQAV